MALVTSTYQADLEIRGGDGRTVVGIAVPFDQPTEIRELGRSYREVFRRGAFARTIAERGPSRVKFLALHDFRKLPLGRAEVLTEDAGGLYGEFRVSKTRDGDEALELIRDGALDGLSVGFEPVQSGDKWNRSENMLERIEVKLREVSAVWASTYRGAVISAVRSEAIPPHLSAEAAAARLRLLLKG